MVEGWVGWIKGRELFSCRLAFVGGGFGGNGRVLTVTRIRRKVRMRGRDKVKSQFCVETECLV